VKPRVAILAGVALVLLVGLPTLAWWVASSREARQLHFRPEGTDLQATDVDTALRELAQKVKQVEGGHAALRGAALAQQAQIGAVQAQVAEKAAAAETRMQALEARAVPPYAQRRRIDYSEGAASTSHSAQYASLRRLGTFSKQDAASEVLLTWSSHVDAMGEPGTFCDFQIRIDGRPDTETDGGGGRAVVYVPAQATGGSSPVTVSALFGQLGAGSHTVAVFVRGTARECLENYGNFPRSVIVEEGGRAGR
jgi:hypothetical protein